MTKRRRSFLFGALVPALLLGSVFAAAQAQKAGSPSVKPTNWSDPATWPDHKVPVAGEKVDIPKDKHVLLDVTPPALDGVTIHGKLSFSDKSDLELTTEWIMLFGELEVGTEAKPHTHKATITLTDNVKDEQLMGMGDRGIMVAGGTLNLHGDRTNTWTKLASTAEAGSNSIEVLNAAQWRVGDTIVLASTDFDPRQAERRTISAIHGNTITLEQKLEYMHFGKITYDVDERGEVGLLTRNIVIQASPDAEQTFFGGHVMAMVSSKMYVSGVEFNRMGQNLTLARYPIHWHLVGDAQGQYVKNSAFHDTYNRCVTVHGTNFVHVENNVTYNTVGHCFFLEDGIEHGNEFVHNLAIQTKCHTSKPCVPTNLAAAGESANSDDRQAVRAKGQTSKDVLIPSDNTVSSYWITNPDNTYRDNVAAGSDSTGFWFALPEHPTGQFEGTDVSKATWPRGIKVREFKGNTAHSNYDSFMFDRGPNPDGTFSVAGGMHIAREDPADRNSKMVESVFEDLTAYKSRNGGIWGRGEMDTFRNLKLADNAIGYTHASGLGGGDPWTSKVVDSLFVGETENIGNPGTDAEKAYGRSLPKPMMPDFPIRGYEYYDMRHDLVNTTFRNFEDNATRKTGAISYLLFASFGVSTENTVERAKFIDAKPVYFPPMERKWGNDNGSGVAWRTAVIHDIDGSVSGVPGAYILINDGVNDSIAADAGVCEFKSTWNAVVCKGDIGRLNIGGVGGRALSSGAGPGGPRGGGAAAEPPVVLSRNGKDFALTQNRSNVRAGAQIKLTTERSALSINVRELDTGSWVIFELPGFTNAASGTEQSSLEALRKASTTSYYKGDGSLWVKLVSSGFSLDAGPYSIPGAGDSLQVSR